MNKFFIILAFIFLLLCLSSCSEPKSLSVGDKAPDFMLTNLNGKKVSLSELLTGKEVILNFWATWCPECQKEIPILNEFAKKYNQKVLIVGVDEKEPKDVVELFSKGKIEYEILMDEKGEVSKLYGIFGVPVNVLINKDGLIKKLNLDIREMESYLKSN